MVRPGNDLAPRDLPAVLLVEDDPSLGTIIQRNLEVRGYRVLRAETAAQALQVLTTETPALMLLDINLPDASGWDVLQALSDRGQIVPTVVLSAVQVSRAHLEQFRPAAYLPKPFSLDALLALVEHAAHHQGSVRVSAERPESSRA